MGTSILKNFRIRIHDLGTTSPGDGTVDFTLTALAEYPDYGQQVIHPARAQTETSPWRFEVVDASAALTGHLADASSGRMHLLGRLVEVQDSTDGGAWTTVCIGRMSDLYLADNPANYVIQVSDERWMERRAIAFDQADTAQLWPPGLRYAWRVGTRIADYAEVEIVSTSGSAKRVKLASQWPISTDILQWIRADVVDDPDPTRTDGSGNFNHLRLEIDGTDYEILTFDDLGGDELVTSLEALGNTGRTSIRAWIWAPSLSSPVRAALWAPTAEPSETLPLHIGEIDGTHSWGYPNPWDLIPAVYDELGVRYDASAFTALKSSVFSPWIMPRLTAPVKDVAEYLDERYYGPLGVVAFVDSQGRIAPKSIRLPDAGSVDPDTLFGFDGDNLRSPPTWEHLGKDIVNIVTAKYDFHRFLAFSGAIAGGHAAPIFSTERSFPADLMFPDHRQRQETHDNLSNLGEHEITVDLTGFVPAGEGMTKQWPSESMDTVERIHKQLARESFERWGDGAQRGTLQALRQIQDGSGRTPEDDVEPGDLVKVSVDTFPNAATNARGGTRIVQIMSRRPVPEGIDFEFVDVGPDLQPLATPTVSVAQNASTPKHAVDITVSGTPSGASVQVQIGVGTSSYWSRTVVDLSDGTTTVKRLPSGTTIFVRGRSAAPNRVRSDWSATDSVATTSLIAPSGLSASQDGESVILTWTNGENDYPVMPTVDGEDFLPSPLPAGSTWFRFANIGQTSAAFGVKHVDGYGGASTITSTTTSGTTANTLSPPVRLRVLQGWSTAEPLTPEDPIFGHGVELRWEVGEIQASTTVQYDTSVGFDVDVQEISVPAGQSTIRITLPLGDSLYYFRAFHERPDHVDSSFTSTVSAKPVFFTREAGPDGFPAGWAFLSVNNSGVMQINVGSSDPDTTAAYYLADLNPGVSEWPDEATVTTGANAITSAQMPYSGNLLDDLGVAIDYTDGDLVFATVRFYNSRLGWGQTVYCTYPPSWLSVPKVDVIPGDTTLTLEISDPAGVVTGVYFKPVSGSGTWDFADPYDGTWTEDTAEPYASSVTLDKKHNSAIGWAVSYDLGPGTQWLGRQCVVFDVDLDPEGTGVPVIAADGESSCNLFGDNDVLSWKVAASTSATPSDATVRAETAINHNSPSKTQVGTLLTAKYDDTVYYKAFPYTETDAGGTEGDPVTFEGTYINELNQISIGGWRWKRNGMFSWDVVIDIKALDGVASINVDYTFWDESASTAYSRSYNQDITGDTSYTLPDTFEQGDAVGNGTFLDNIRITPYDDTGGDSGSGNAGATRVVYGMEAYSTSGTFEAPFSPQDVIVSSATDPGATNYPPGTLWFKT